MALVNIKVETLVNISLNKAWQFWTTPEHIKQWNAASETWHTPTAANDLQVGGEFHYLMAAKDGSMQFDYWGTYEEIVPDHHLAFTLGDGRKVTVDFEETDGQVRIVEVFEAEQTNATELQKNGWQAILDRFKYYSEQSNEKGDGIMAKMIFLNLPVKDLPTSKNFFTALGYHFNPQFTDDTAACMVISETIFAMLLTHSKFDEFAPRPIADSKTCNEVLTALSFDSREEIDVLVDKALKLGATENYAPKDYGFMYSRSFSDLDGHIWEAFWMDPSHVQ